MPAVIVCHCNRRSAAEVLACAAVCASADPADVAEAAGAGDDCGSCLATIERLLARVAAAPADVSETCAA